MGCTDGESIHDIPGAYEAFFKRQQERRAVAVAEALGECPDCGCTRARCEGYGYGRKCCPDCKHPAAPAGEEETNP